MSTIYHTEQDGKLTLTIGQEWEGAGLYWELTSPAICGLPRYQRRSSGRFYLDSHGETIHGATLADVIQTAITSAKSFSR